MRHGTWMAVLALAGAAGCTTVRLEQRDGCWVRQTEKWGWVTEQIGPCERPAMAWVTDRPTRLVQECVAHSDWRWQNEALAAWERGEPLPDRPDDRSLLEACHVEAARTVTQENESLRERLDGAMSDRDRVLTHNEHLADVLGEAALKPAGTATATANADGRSTSTNDSKSTHAADVKSSQAADVTSPAPVLAPTPIVVPLPAAPERAPTRVVVREVPRGVSPRVRPDTSRAAEDEVPRGVSPGVRTDTSRPASVRVTTEETTSDPQSLVCEPQDGAPESACECECETEEN